MEWQAVVLAVQILLLAAGWMLFQRARGELSARAAETPVLGEVKALQENIKRLLAEFEAAADQKADSLEQRCEQARALLETLEARLSETNQTLQIMAALAEEGTTSEDLQTDPAPAPLEPISALRMVTAGSDAEMAAESSIIEGRTAREDNDNSDSHATASSHKLRNHLVFSLADAGEEPAAIARATHLSEGEVETLLGLRLQKP